MPPNNKNIYQKKAEERLKKLKAEITTLEKQSQKAEADIEVRFDQKLKQIRGQYAQAKEKLSILQVYIQNDWHTLKADVEEAMDTLSEAIDSVTKHISAQPEKRNNQ